MKKFILSIFVIASFGFYVIWQNLGNSSNSLSTPIAIVSSNNTKNNQQSNSATSKQKSSSTSIPTFSKTGTYRDGEYTGDIADAYYGNMQVRAVILGGKLVDIQFLDYPRDARNSVQINSYALPILKQEAIQAQSAKIDAVSGASASSPAFIESLTSALNKAKA